MANRKLNRIKGALSDAGKTSKELAEHLGVDIGTVSRWCRNVQQPPLETLYDIADFLHIPVAQLLLPNKYTSPAASGIK